MKTYRLTSDQLNALREIDNVNADLRARNLVRLAAAKEALGEKYILHPVHSPKSKPKSESVLSLKCV